MDIKNKIVNFFSLLIDKVLNCDLINVANLLTFLRILFIIPLFFFILNNNYRNAFRILLLSGITDFFDGIFARVLDQSTEFGKSFDPLADKLTLISIMICFGIKFKCVIPFIMFMIAKEICMLLVGAFMLKKFKSTIKAKWYGKIATVFFYFSVLSIILIKVLWNVENKFVISTLMEITALLMFYALIRYFVEFVSIVRSENSKSK